MNIGDKIIVQNIEYTVWFIEEETMHLIDENGNGIAILKQ